MTTHRALASLFHRTLAAPPLLTSTLASLGLGLLFGLVWSARNTGSSVTEWQVFLARFASMGAFLALALACKTKTPRPRTMLLVAAVCLLGHGGCGLLANLLTNTSELIALGAVSVVFEGVGVAVMQLLFVQALAASPIKRGIACVAGAYVVAELTYFALLLIPTASVPLVVQVGELLCLAVLLWLRIVLAPQKPVTPAAAVAQEPVVLAGTPLIGVVGCLVCLTGAWGFFAQMTGEGAHAFFDTTSEIAMIAVRLLLVLVLLQVGSTITFDRIVVALAMMWATGILLVGVLWGTAAPSTSALVIKAGLYGLQELSLAVVLRYAQRHPNQLYYAGGLVLCALMSAHVSRLGMLLVFANEPVTGSAVVAVMGCAAWCVAASLAIVVACTRGQHEDSGVAFESSNQRAVEFHQRFERFCTERRLSQRERDVLLETLHGYTVDAVAEKLSLSRETVKTYLSRIYSRAGVGGRQELLGMLDRE